MPATPARGAATSHLDRPSTGSAIDLRKERTRVLSLPHRGDRRWRFQALEVAQQHGSHHEAAPAKCGERYLPALLFWGGALLSREYCAIHCASREISVFGSSRTAPETPNSRRDRIHSKSTILTTIRAPAFFLSPTAIAAIARAWLLARRATARRHPTRLLGLLSGTAWPVSFLGPCVHPRSRSRCRVAKAWVPSHRCT